MPQVSIDNIGGVRDGMSASLHIGSTLRTLHSGSSMDLRETRRPGPDPALGRVFRFSLEPVSGLRSIWAA